jgi:hypothetical protein
MWAAGIAVLVAALVVTMVWMLGDPPVRRGPGLGAAAAAAVVDARPLGDGRPAQAPTELASIPITSTPLGATVFDGDRVVGTTPTAYRTTVRDAEVTLVARLPGHDDAVFSVNPIVDRGRSAADPVLVTLTPTATGAGSASTGSGTPRPIDKHRPPRGDGRTTGSGAAGSASVGGVDAAGGGDLQGNPYRRAQGSAAGSAR